MDDTPTTVANVAQAVVAAVPHSDAKEIMALMIPIIAIVMGIGIGMLALWLDYRRKRDVYALFHKERMAAIEKGMEVPPLPTDFFNDYNKGRQRPIAEYLRRGLVWLFIGAAVVLGLYGSGDHENALWGLIPTGFGAANLLYYVIARRNGHGNSDPG
jgi:Domain of unknown function (DUF6249)